MKFKTRIWLLPVAAAAIFVSGGLVNYTVSLKTASALDGLRHEHYPFQESVGRLTAQVETFRLVVQSAASEGDASKVEEARALAKAVQDDVQT
jgi:methyl-accepting chemotaxis protein